MAGKPGVGGRPPRRPTLTPALRAALNRKSDSGELNKTLIANKLVELAIAGDVQALKLVYERVDGRPVETVDATVEHSGGVRWVMELVDADPNDPAPDVPHPA